MSATGPAPDAPPRRAAGVFRYLGYEIDLAGGRVECSYALDDELFSEAVTLDGASIAAGPAADEVARIYFLLAGVSYYKAGAPPVVDLGQTPMRPGDVEFLSTFYIDGLGEYAYRNGLDLTGLQIAGGTRAEPPAPYEPGNLAPLIPFGGGIDSIVAVEEIKARTPSAALFVMSAPEVRFAAIEAAAEVTGLPVLRAERRLDPKILRSGQLGYLNGHVPVTGILSSVATLVAVMAGRDAVVMSNEWSASVGNVLAGDRMVNHQYSKSHAFETAYRRLLQRSFTDPPEYFSLLRPYSELWVAQRFTRLTAYHLVFRSCNRAFHIDAAQRLDHWCGRCSKCCFIDLILSPWMPAEALRQVFAGREPLDDPALLAEFDTLVGLSPDPKPFECVGETGECQAAALLAHRRPDRQGSPVLDDLAARLEPATVATSFDHLLQPLSDSHIPDRYAPEDLVG